MLENLGLLVVVGIVAVVGVIAALIGIVLYNRLVAARVETQNAWSQIDVQLKRRYDLIPNLVETVKGYAQHERETLERVVQARNQAVAAPNLNERVAAEQQLTTALRGLFALAEAYPDLKANQNFLALQEELTATENRIGFARQYYNDVVSRYNTLLMSFPTNLFASAFDFEPAPFFELDPAEAAAVQQPPKVQF